MDSNADSAQEVAAHDGDSGDAAKTDLADAPIADVLDAALADGDSPDAEIKDQLVTDAGSSDTSDVAVPPADMAAMDMAAMDMAAMDMAAMDMAAMDMAGMDMAGMDMAGMDMEAPQDADTEQDAEANPDTEAPEDAKVDATDVAQSDASPPGPAKLGFASQMDGKVAVFDLDTMKHYVDVGEGHSMVHGSGSSNNQNILWYPNPDTQKLDRYERGATPAQWTKTKSFPAPFTFLQVKSSADGSVVGLANGTMVYSIDFAGGSGTAADKFVAFDTASESWLAPISVPSASVFDINADGTKAYVANRFDHKVVVVAPKTGVVLGTYDVLPEPSDQWWYGPAEVALSKDGKWLVATNLELGTFSLFDTSDMENPVVVEVGKKLHSTCFSPDGERIFVQYLSSKPSPNDELGNAMIPSSLLAFDRKTLKQVGELFWTWSSAHVQAPPWGDSIYMSASFSAIVRYNAKTLQFTGEQILMPGMPMPIMSIRF